MKNLLLILTLILNGALFSQTTNVTITLKGESDAEWMCGKTYTKNGIFTHQATECYDGHLFIDAQTIEIVINKPGGYCVRMKSGKYDKVTMVYFQVNEGDNYEIFKRVQGKLLNIGS
jgi:hypothetical protein